MIPDAAEQIETKSKPSNGLVWAMVMLALEVVELLVLIEVVFFDRPQAPMGTGSGLDAVEIYLAVVAATVVLQIIGILLVLRGKYRAGGIYQIVSSAIHALKGEGIIGIIGGLKAYRFSAELKE